MSEKVEQVLFLKKASLWFRGLGAIMVILSHYAEWWSWFYVEEGTSELIRYGISKFGPYGVAIFLLFSGYGLTKSAGNKRIDGIFIVKRVLGVYVPYLLVVALIKMLSGGFDSAKDFVDLLYGDDFWYMTVMFSLYIAFLVIWLVFANTYIRACLMTLFTVWYSYYLYKGDNYDFWYISNIAFAFGVLLALYEPILKKVLDKTGVIVAVLFGVGSVLVVRSALFVEHTWTDPVQEIWSRIIAVVIFTLFIVAIAAVWKWYDPVLSLLGKFSLYLYLSHTFLFMWVINYFKYEMAVNFAIAAGVILIISIVVGLIISHISQFLIANIVQLRKNRD